MYRANKTKTNTHSRSSSYTGVKWSREYQKWYSSLNEKGVTYHCGFFDIDREAARARDMKIVQIGSAKPLQVLKRPT